MTNQTPIERAAEALFIDHNPDSAQSTREQGIPEPFGGPYRDSARVVFASIDRDWLIHWWETFDGPAYPTGEQFADTFKAALTGADS